ncbi:MAG: polysaccharide biosynthesis/export family protein [Burkholderiaceae bacterium]
MLPCDQGIVLPLMRTFRSVPSDANYFGISLLKGTVVKTIAVTCCLGGAASAVHAQSAPATLFVAQAAPQTTLDNNAPVAEMVAASRYRLRPGDVISIRVFGEDDFTRDKVRLNDAGTISFPFLGELPVLEKTVGEIQDMLTQRLKGRYLIDPRVTVWIEEYRPIFVNGMVERPGAFPYQPGLNVRKAASLAGGFKERASMNKIYVVKEGDRQKPLKVSVDTEIAPGDTIYVEESFF